MIGKQFESGKINVNMKIGNFELVLVNIENTEYSLGYLAPDCYRSLYVIFMIVTYTMFVFVAIKNNYLSIYTFI